jgi:CRP-like cAMP-binding protein
MNSTKFVSFQADSIASGNRLLKKRNYPAATFSKPYPGRLKMSPTVHPLEKLERRVYQKGQTIFREGEVGDVAFLLEGGLVTIRKSNGAEEVPIGIIEVGGLFGEMALVDDEPRMASAFAARQSVCVIIPSLEFRRKLARADPLIRGLLEIFVKSLRTQTALRLDAEAGLADNETSVAEAAE